MSADHMSDEERKGMVERLDELLHAFLYYQNSEIGFRLSAKQDYDEQRESLIAQLERDGLALAEAEQRAADWQDCYKLADASRDEWMERAAAAEARLPEGMKHCTILFKECEKGHGRLTATNWIDHGCHHCALAAVEAELSALDRSHKALLAETGTALAEAKEEIAKQAADLATFGKDTEATENRIIDAEFAVQEAKTALAAAEAEHDALRKALSWISDQRWNEDADLDEICTHADRALTPSPPASNLQCKFCGDSGRPGYVVVAHYYDRMEPTDVIGQYRLTSGVEWGKCFHCHGTGKQTKEEWDRTPSLPASRPTGGGEGDPRGCPTPGACSCQPSLAEARRQGRDEAFEAAELAVLRMRDKDDGSAERWNALDEAAAAIRAKKGSTPREGEDR